MMTKSKKILMLMLTFVVSVAGYAKTDIDGIYYNLNSETKEAEVTSGAEKYSGDIEIPSTVACYGMEFKVTCIESCAFEDCSSLTSVTIPNSVTSIGFLAFSGCSGLTSVTIPNSVTSIGMGAFAGCWYLTSVTIPNSVTNIGDGAFSQCPRLISITIPNSILSIENSTFFNCKSLTSITIPNSVISIGEYAFGVCHALTSVTIPNSVTSIAERAFAACIGLKSVTLPESLTVLGNNTFVDSDSLITVINLSKTPQNISDGTFSVYGTLHVLPGCKAAYEVADVWKNFTIVEDADRPAEIIAVEDLIAVIGKVENTEESKAKIAAARSAYDALTKEQQALVKNLSVLVEAEKAYKQFETTGIADVETKDGNKDGKFLENGKIVIVRNGKNYSINGLAE